MKKRRSKVLYSKRLNNEKGQASMEFLMVYGWAILAAVVAIGVLAYYGVFTPGKSLPSLCFVEAPLGCSEFEVAVDGVRLFLINGAGTAINVTNVSLPGTPACGSNSTLADLIPDGGKFEVIVSCPGLGNSGEKFDGKIEIRYILAGKQIEQKASGDIKTDIRSSLSGGPVLPIPPVCGDGSCNGAEVCGVDDVAPSCNTDCSICSPPTVTGLLVSHYTFEVNAQDTVGDYDGILHNGTSIVTDPVRVKVAKFDGINDYIQMPSSEKLNNNYTLSIWVKFDGSNSQQEIIDSRMGENHFLVRRTSGGIVQFSDWTGGGIEGVIYSNGSLSVGEWTHIVLVKDNNVLKMYIDKILQTDTNTTSGSLTYTNTAIDLGAASGSSGGSSQYNGSLDDFMVYNKSLNQSEVNALYNSQYIAPSCTNGQTQSCSNQAGVCSGSFETCAGNSWPGCGASEYGAGYEATETSCFDNIDNDCNGLKDYQDFDSCSFGTGLVAYWKGEGNLNDELGTYSSGNLAGAATATVTGVNSSKQAFSTNGVSGTYINLTESNPFGYTGNFSYGAWFKWAGNVGTKGILTRYSNGGYMLYLPFSNLITCASFSSSLILTSSNLAVSSGVWYHAMCVHNGTHMTLYVNGVLQNDVDAYSSVTMPTYNKVLIGLRYNNQLTLMLFNGTIDEVMIFNRSLSDDEVQAIYNP